MVDEMINSEQAAESSVQKGLSWVQAEIMSVTAWRAH